jgi:hypothetical protein
MTVVTDDVPERGRGWVVWEPSLFCEWLEQVEFALSKCIGALRVFSKPFVVYPSGRFNPNQAPSGCDSNVSTT